MYILRTEENDNICPAEHGDTVLSLANPLRDLEEEVLVPCALPKTGGQHIFPSLRRLRPADALNFLVDTLRISQWIAENELVRIEGAGVSLTVKIGDLRRIGKMDNVFRENMFLPDFLLRKTIYEESINAVFSPQNYATLNELIAAEIENLRNPQDVVKFGVKWNLPSGSRPEEFVGILSGRRYTWNKEMHIA
jgi:hypothetical protein